MHHNSIKHNTFGQGYNILIDQMHLLFTPVHFLFWQPGRAVGQYTTFTSNLKLFYWYITKIFNAIKTYTEPYAERLLAN